MLNTTDILSTIDMIREQKLDIRTITMGISLLECIGSDTPRRVYDLITRRAERLVQTGEDIENEFGIPIVNKRISVTPVALLLAGGCDPVDIARALDRAAETTGVNFVGGYSALVQKGATKADLRLINSIPEALAETTRVCSSVNIGSTRAGINMDAVKLMGEIMVRTTEATAAHRRPGLLQAGGVCQRGRGQPVHGGRVPRRGRGRRGHQRGRERPGRGQARAGAGQGRAVRRGGRNHQEDRLQDHPHGPAGGDGGQPPPGRALRHRRPVPGPDARRGRLGGAYPGGDGP